MKQKRMLFFLFALLAAVGSWAQGASPIIINGEVKDGNGLSLANVSITEKGTTNTVISNEAGVFRITVKSKNAELAIQLHYPFLHEKFVVFIRG